MAKCQQIFTKGRYGIHAMEQTKLQEYRQYMVEAHSRIISLEFLYEYLVTSLDVFRFYYVIKMPSFVMFWLIANV